MQKPKLNLPRESETINSKTEHSISENKTFRGEVQPTGEKKVPAKEDGN